MWAINNKTPYAAERNWVLDKNAEKSWVVVVKATYDIGSDGSTRLAEEQEQLPLYSPKYSAEPGKSSLIYEADLLGPKQNTDVILNGYAYAEHGKPTTNVNVSLTVKNMTKRLLVFGDRYWRRGALDEHHPLDHSAPVRLHSDERCCTANHRCNVRSG